MAFLDSARKLREWCTLEITLTQSLEWYQPDILGEHELSWIIMIILTFIGQDKEEDQKSRE